MTPGPPAQLARLRGVYPLADDDPRWKHRPPELVAAALAGGATVVQLRLKHTGDREALALARWAVERTRSAGALLVVNDRFDLADLADADGVHLGADDLPPERIPSRIRQRLLVGLSTHTLEQVDASRDRPVDHIAFGPVFDTSSKDSAHDARGLDLLREAVRRAGRPVVAIGGITPERIEAVSRAGACAAAVISAIALADDPTAATRVLGERFAAGSEAGV